VKWNLRIWKLKSLSTFFQTIFFLCHCQIFGKFSANNVQKINFPQINFPQIGFPQIGFPQIGFPQIGFPQIGFPQIGFPQMDDEFV
jgi:hypothetical protein